MSATTTAARSPASRGDWLSRTRQRIFRREPADFEPVVLRHSRIYILPTRRGLAFIATLATMLVTSLNYALSLGFAVTFLLAGLAAAALLHTFRNLAGLELRPLGAGETFAGNALPFMLALAGNGVARVAVTVAASGNAPVTTDVAADGATPATLPVATTRRGRVALGRVTLSSDYPLGLWRGWAYVHFPLTGVVYPDPEPNAPPLPGGTGGEDSYATDGGEHADLAGLRGYQPGDPMHRIAWKAVARGIGWHTKQFEGAGGGGPVVLDWRTLPAGLDAEHKIARLAAWALAAEREARPYALAIPGTALPAGRGREHRRAVLTALALCAVEHR